MEESITLLDREHIVSNSIPAFPKCGVYFLIKNDEIVYVGRTADLVRRLETHKRWKDFDRVFYIECPREELNELEKRYIRKFAPPGQKIPKEPKPEKPAWVIKIPQDPRGRANWDAFMEARAKRKAENDAKRARLNFPEGDK